MRCARAAAALRQKHKAKQQNCSVKRRDGIGPTQDKRELKTERSCDD